MGAVTKALNEKVKAVYMESKVSDWVGRALLPDDITEINMRF